MTVSELLKLLAAAFPYSFRGQASMDAWAPAYAAALGQFEGPKLAAAYENCIVDWAGSNAPKPADIRKYLGGGSKLGAFNARQHFETTKRECALICDDWWRLNSEPIAAFLASFPPEDQDPARSHVRDAVRKLAWTEAQLRALGRPLNAVVLPAEEWQRIRGCVESQRRAAGFGNVAQKADLGSLRQRAKPLRQNYLDDEPAMGETA